MQSQHVKRVVTAASKFAFCWRVTSTVSSFLKLLRNTKRFAWKKKPAVFERRTEVVRYSLKMEGVHRNIFLRTYDGDIQIFYEIFWRSAYSLPPAIFIEARTIVDLGAHAGLAALYFRMQSPNAKIYAVEADELNYGILLKNLQVGIESGQVFALHAAIARENGTMYLQRSILSYNNTVSESVTGLSIRGISMEQLLDDYQITMIDILKIDIEGAETDLFSMGTAWLRKVRNILIEIHSDVSMERFKQSIVSHGFKIEQRTGEHETIYWAYKPSDSNQ